MAKILLTGMTSAHVSESLNTRSKSFMGAIADALSAQGHVIVWQKFGALDPVEAYKDFDAVLVGVSPIGGLSANYAYGALNTIDRLWGSPKLFLVVDAPNASQIEPNLKLIQSNPENFVKPFFSSRFGYRDLIGSTEDVTRLLGAIDKLLNEEWPTTIWPRLPWKLSTDIKLPPNAKANLSGVNLDAFLLEKLETPKADEPRVEKWVADNTKAKWTLAITKTLAQPVFNAKLSKNSTDEEVFQQLKRALGVLIAPDYRDGTWWTYRLVQALKTNTPIVTEWKESGNIGTPWDMLAASVESLNSQQRHLLSLAQLDVYVANIDNKTSALQKLEELLKIGRK